jgi:hypothetical protein
MNDLLDDCVVQRPACGAGSKCTNFDGPKASRDAADSDCSMPCAPSRSQVAASSLHWRSRAARGAGVLAPKAGVGVHAAVQCRAHGPCGLHQVACRGARMGRAGGVPRARPADEQHAVVARMHQRMRGRQVAVRPAGAVHEGQHLEHAAPQPHGVARIDARRVGQLHVLQAAPETGRVAQHQGLAGAVAVVLALGHAHTHQLRQAPREVGRAGHGQVLQRPQHLAFAHQHGVGGAVARELQRDAFRQRAEALGKQHLAVLAGGQRREHAVARAAPGEDAPACRAHA